VSVEVRRAADCFVTTGDGVLTRHHFSFGAHYDSRHTGFGELVACNLEQLEPGAGFPGHPHRALEIVTWVLEGAVRHRDSAGHDAVVRPGEVQHLRAGTGVVHEESNAAAGRTRFVQLWLVAAEPLPAPSYDRRDVSSALREGELVPVLDSPAVRVARLGAGRAVALPAAERVHLLVTRGVVELGEAGLLRAGDSARLSAKRGHQVRASERSEVLVVEMGRYGQAAAG
jgi:redox-sensitive bicupin YhaK (pirin superfamily)